jgi:hypothetical protein
LNKITIYEYDKQNREYFADELEKQGFRFFLVPLSDDLKINFDNYPDDMKGLFVDISPYFRDDEKGILYSVLVEKLINSITNEVPLYIIINRKYTYSLKDLLFFKIDRIESLETAFNLNIPISKNIVDMGEQEFLKLINTIDKELIGNAGFKKRLFEELRKFRVFNRLDYQPIFSTLICGNSGIGKTELARVIHRYLSPKEQFIKINFGNYSDQNALSSLIGSPRGYVGSSKGELSDKLANSKSKVILIVI